MVLAAAGTIFLLSPITSVTPPPPLQSIPSAVRSQVETRFVGRADSRELIEVGVRPDGTPVRVTATQRLDLRGTGDYYFVVQAPATAIRPGPGTQSQPGLRDLGIVWQGFADKRRTLSATVTLHPAAAAKGLPLKISVERAGGAWQVRLRNVTAKRFEAVSGRAALPALQEQLRGVRSQLARHPAVAGNRQVAGEL